MKKKMTDELKTYLPLVSALVSRGKSTSEEDARILLNDILHSVLGYDKYSELKTEKRDRNGRIDYAVKLTDGPLKNKPDKFDFVIEAKACHVELNQIVVDQTMSYCLTMGLEFFVLTNAQKWQLYQIHKQGKSPVTSKILELHLNSAQNIEELVEDFYLFSRESYILGNWKEIANVTQATRTEDVAAVLLSDKVIRAIARELSQEHDVKVGDETVREIVEREILAKWGGDHNKKLLKRLNEKPKREEKEGVPHPPGAVAVKPVPAQNKEELKVA